MSDAGAEPAPKTRSLAGVSDADARALLHENERLVAFVLKRWFRGDYEDTLAQEDMLAISQTALVRAWLTWEPAKGAWSTHAITLIKRDLWHALNIARVQRRQTPVYVIPTDPTYLEDPMETSETGVRARGHEGVSEAIRLHCEASVDDACERINERLDVEHRLEWLHRQLRKGLLSARQAEIVELALTGKTFAEIAGRVGDCSRQNCQNQYAAALEKLRRAAVRDGLV